MATLTATFATFLNLCKCSKQMLIGINKSLLHFLHKCPLYSRSIYKGQNVAKAAGLAKCVRLGITGDDGRGTGDKERLWKAWKYGKLKISHITTLSTTLLPQGNGDFKKNSFFYFYERRETKDKRRRTKDEERGTDGRTCQANQRSRKHTQNIAQNRQIKFKQNQGFV